MRKCQVYPTHWAFPLLGRRQINVGSVVPGSTNRGVQRRSRHGGLDLLKKSLHLRRFAGDPSHQIPAIEESFLTSTSLQAMVCTAGSCAAGEVPLQSTDAKYLTINTLHLADAMLFRPLASRQPARPLLTDRVCPALPSCRVIFDDKPEKSRHAGLLAEVPRSRCRRRSPPKSTFGTPRARLNWHARQPQYLPEAAC